VDILKITHQNGTETLQTTGFLWISFVLKIFPYIITVLKTEWLVDLYSFHLFF